MAKAATKPPPAPKPRPAERFYPARVVDHGDGDSFEVEADVGFHTARTETVRLTSRSGVGVQCAELDASDPADRVRAKRAQDRTAALVPLGQWVGIWTTLNRQRDKRDGFRRYLARVDLPDGSDLGDTLLAEGLGVPYRRK